MAWKCGGDILERGDLVGATRVIERYTAEIFPKEDLTGEVGVDVEI